MNTLPHIIQRMKDEFQRWDSLLCGLDEQQAIAREKPSEWSIKDEVAHLMVWQQRTVARLEAALHNRQPVFPAWPQHIDTGEEEPVDEINAWLHETQRDRPWANVYSDWKNCFQRLIELGQTLPEKDLLEVGKYPWLPDYPLAIIMESSCDHHAEHYDPLVARLGH